MTANKKVVTAFNGVRDSYQLPLAFAELGLLQKHVTDIYLSDSLAKIASKKNLKVASRHTSGLSYDDTSISLRAAYENIKFKIGRNKKLPDPYLSVDQALSLKAASIASIFGSDLYLHSGYAFWAFQLCNNTKKTIFQFHPHPSFAYDVLINDYERYSYMKWSFENEVDSKDPKRTLPIERIDEWKYADKFTCASTFTKRSLVDLGVDPLAINVVPYGNGSAQAHTHSSTKRNSKMRFLFVGQAVQRKGVHHLLEVWKRIAGKIPAELWFVSRKVDPGLRKLLSTPDVKFFNGLSSKELSDAFKACDVFVMPSLVEGFGLVYSEALSYGMPCIGTTNTGLPDIIVDPIAKIYAKPGDLEELESQMLNCFKLWKERAWDREAIASSAASFGWPEHRARLVAAY